MRPKWKLIVIKLRICKRDDYTCKYCNVRLWVKQKSSAYIKLHRKLTIDHVIPLSKGGTWKDDNLVAACKDCNVKKGDKIL